MNTIAALDLQARGATAVIFEMARSIALTYKELDEITMKRRN